jgi:hydrogenase nickel incorporation protein HypA/HybF
MHEYSIVQALIDRVDAEARAHGASTVRSLSVRIGELSGVEVDLLTTAYATFRDRTICERADLNVRRIAARWECPDCGRPIGHGDVLRCAACDAPAQLTEGDEIVLDRIEMEVP